MAERKELVVMLVSTAIAMISGVALWLFGGSSQMLGTITAKHHTDSSKYGTRFYLTVRFADQSRNLKEIEEHVTFDQWQSLGIGKTRRLCVMNHQLDSRSWYAVVIGLPVFALSLTVAVLACLALIGFDP